MPLSSFSSFLNTKKVRNAEISPKIMTMTGNKIKEGSILTELNVTMTKAGRVILKIIFEITAPSFSFKMFIRFNR